MTIDPDIRLKVRHFFKKNGRLIVIIAFVILLIVIINRLLTLNSAPDAPVTSYTPHTTVLDDTQDVPEEVADSFEVFIENYVKYCNNRDYVSAYNLISEDCKKNFFGNSYNNFVNYVSEKFDGTKSYAIQSYSHVDDKYIYSVKLYDNFLATGLTNQKYRYVEEKMAINYDEDGNIVFSVGNYMGSKDLQFQASNDYLVARVTKSVEKYSFIIYNLELTNRSNYTVVVQDGNADDTEIFINIGNEARGCVEEETKIVLLPGETKNVTISFSKFYDSDTEVESLVLNSVRVMENYTGDPEMAQEEIDNAIYKASMTISMQ